MWAPDFRDRMLVIARAPRQTDAPDAEYRRGMPDTATLEEDVHRIGRELAAAFPSAARHPLRALDERAMDYASQDLELRAALFRFVDVVPACRSLDDLARHLTSFLDRVEDRPPPSRPR